jgi:hypothetical protein
MLPVAAAAPHERLDFRCCFISHVLRVTALALY